MFEWNFWVRPPVWSILFSKKSPLPWGENVCLFFCSLPTTVFSLCTVPHAFHDLLWWSFCDWGGEAGVDGGGLSCPSDKLPIENISRSELKVSSCEPSLSFSSYEDLMWPEGSSKVSSAGSLMISGWLFGQMSQLWCTLKQFTSKRTVADVLATYSSSSGLVMYTLGHCGRKVLVCFAFVLCDTLLSYGVPLEEDWTVWHTSKSLDMEARFQKNF